MSCVATFGRHGYDPGHGDWSIRDIMCLLFCLDGFGFLASVCIAEFFVMFCPVFKAMNYPELLL